jgi:hypothetical protein
MQRQTTVISLIIAVVLIAGGLAYYRQYQQGQDIANDSSIRTVVTQFGTTMQKVSLSAPDAVQQIGNAYSPYASEALVNKWKQQKEFAPGRGTSSPYPDHIDIISLEKAPNNTYLVKANVIEMTSTGIAGQFPLTLTMGKAQNQWVITSYEPGPYQPIGGAATSTQ